MSTPFRAWKRVLAGCCLLACACRSTGPDHIPTEPERVEMLKLMLPHAIQIQPFTSIRSFNDDETPDGILMVVRPVDRFGDPVKAAGQFYFELWTYVNASGERRGERLAYWERTIASRSEVELYWTRAQMYEFKLAWTQGAEGIQPERKYLLTASWRTPWEETVQDEYVLDFHLPFETLTDVPGSPAGGSPAGPSTRPAAR